MSKEDLIKLVVGFLLIVALAASFYPENETVVMVSAIATFFVIVGAISLGVERGTELLKIILRFAFGNVGFLKFLQPSGAGSVFLAFIVAYAGVNQFSPDIFSGFEAFGNLDTGLISLLTVALTWIGSSLMHTSLPANVGKAQPLK